MLDLLAQMYAETGRWGDALRTAQSALAAAERENNFRLMGALKVRMESYEAHLKDEPHRTR
jgi:regulator of sirC expression with transglutaminase-like and TPR domain